MFRQASLPEGKAKAIFRSPRQEGWTVPIHLKYCGQCLTINFISGLVLKKDHGLRAVCLWVYACLRVPYADRRGKRKARNGPTRTLANAACLCGGAACLKLPCPPDRLRNHNVTPSFQPPPAAPNEINVSPKPDRKPTLSISAPNNQLLNRKTIFIRFLLDSTYESLSC